MSGIEQAAADNPAAARRAAVLGSPIAHSLSPILHRAAYRRLGLDGWSYDAFEVDDAALPGFVAGLDAAKWAGLSLTMPLKRAIIPLLDTVGATARAVEAVNTVVFGADGSRRGENTDVPGLVAALSERGITTVPTAAVLGGGATAASALAALAEVAKGSVDVYVRSLERAAQLGSLVESLGLDARLRLWDEAAKGLDSPLVINTTPSGAADELVAAVPTAPGALFDVLYHPWPTPLAAAWERGGGCVLGGLDLLIHQAVLQVELMTGCDPSHRADLVAEMREAGTAALAARDS
ncbi:MAG TPA: shikimate dehydrogenase [Actinocrinis sp.]|uniref:shikimate dehydrogenase n=1 Tax=Actinocrinis sp. TaxID=1920516 RepID=UPI002DDCDE90|nr:shikimate dehydrogenase [Actinocrinis sp.]HEV3169474.1 shikimate dehydrogenase [Actinocrinis sp.]